MNGTEDTFKGEMKIKQEIEEPDFQVSSIKIEPNFECKLEPKSESELEESNFVFVTSADVKTEIFEDVKNEMIDDIADTESQNDNHIETSLNQNKTQTVKYVERKSYECGTCGDHFEKLTKFISHLKTHGDSEQAWEKSLLCDICEKPFETLSNLNRHRSSSHKIYEKSLATKMLEDCLVRFTQSGIKMDVGSDEQNSNREAYMVSIGNYRKRKNEDKNDKDSGPSNSKQNSDEKDSKSDKTFKPTKKKSYYKKKRQDNMIDLPEGTDKKQYFLALEAALKNRKTM